MKILIVDDEPLVRLALQKIFSRNGWEVQTEEDGLKGLKTWLEWEPEVVLLDVMMPKLSGPEVLRKIRPNNAIVILMSAFAGDFDLGKARAEGAHYFIAKPFDSVFSVLDFVESVTKSKGSDY